MDSKFIKSVIEELGTVWKDIDTTPEEEGFVVVARFNDAGNLVDISENYVYIKALSSEIIYNGGGRSIIDPTHYISRKELKRLLQLIPREDKSGGIII